MVGPLAQHKPETKTCIIVDPEVDHKEGSEGSVEVFSIIKLSEKSTCKFQVFNLDYS